MIKIEMPERRINLARFMLDTNLINARQNNKDVNQLEAWDRNEIIELIYDETTHQELKEGYKKGFKKAVESIYTVSDSSELESDFLKIRLLLFPDCVLNDNQKNDVKLILNAQKYGYHFVTNDGGSKNQPGGILGNKKEINKLIFPQKIMDSKEAVEFVKNEIRKRDEFAKKVNIHDPSLLLPEWVGRD